MFNNLEIIVKEVYNKLNFNLTNLVIEKESTDYEACKFKLNDLSIICRTSKITPKKIGQFVTVWKRIGNGPIEPFNVSDEFDFFVINSRGDNNFGQFIFPKSILLKKGIVSNTKEGKRGIRVYPPWCKPTSKQAIITQKWQLIYFLPIDIDKPIDLKRAEVLYLVKR